jgi:hypothetical protein
MKLLKGKQAPPKSDKKEVIITKEQFEDGTYRIGMNADGLNLFEILAMIDIAKQDLIGRVHNPNK